jgi:hypothetical protein
VKAAKSLVPPGKPTRYREIDASNVHALDELVHIRQSSPRLRIELLEPPIAREVSLAMLDDFIGKDMDVGIDDWHTRYRKKYQIARSKPAMKTSAISR